MQAAWANSTSAVRLLPVRPDHGGDGAPDGEPEADGRRHRERDGRQHLPVRRPTSASAPRSTTPPRRWREGGCHADRDNPLSLTSSRRAFLGGTAATAGALILGITIAFPRMRRWRRKAAASIPGRLSAERLRAHRPGQHRHGDRASTRDGPGHLHRPCHLVAEELDADWAQMRVEGAPADAKRLQQPPVRPGAGHRRLDRHRQFLEQMRKAGAAARAMLVAGRGRRSGRCRPARSRSSAASSAHAAGKHRPLRRARRGRGEAAGAGECVKLKDPKDFSLIGKTRAAHRRRRPRPTAPRDSPSTCKLPDMLTAVVAHPPRFGAQGRRASTTARRARRARRASTWSRCRRGVAVIANGYLVGEEGPRGAEGRWDEAAAGSASAPRSSWPSTAALGADSRAGRRATTAMRRRRSPARRRCSRPSYEFPYLAHAPMEPMNCVVELRTTRRRAKSGIGEQFQTVDQATIAGILGLTPEQGEARHAVRRRQLRPARERRRRTTCVEAAHDRQGDAAATAPVKLVWTREDDMRGGYYRPMSTHRMRAGLDAQGKIVALAATRVVGQSILDRHALRGDDGQGRHRSDQRSKAPPTPPTRSPNIARRAAQRRRSACRCCGGARSGTPTPRYAMETLHRRARRGGGQGSGRVPARAARRKHPRHAGGAQARGGEGGWGKPLGRGPRPRRRRARVVRLVRGAGGGGLGRRAAS